MIIGTSVETFEERRAELERDAETFETFEHADGSVTFIVIDQDGETSNPRDDDGNVATLIQENSRSIDIDTDVAGLQTARDQFRHEPELMDRYLAMFRPDIAVYVDYWSAGRESYGWGYVTREALAEAGYSGQLSGTLKMRARALFDSEVDVYGQWAEGEVYGFVHLEPGAEIAVDGPTEADVEHEGPFHEVEEDSCYGFLGYGSLEEIAAQATDSPIV